MISAVGWNTGRSCGDTKELWCYWLCWVVCSAFLYTLYQTPIYRAYATLELQGIQEPFQSVRLE